MRLRTFLVRRAVHTMITLVIVLVLLFVIFRLMPGDPTRFFIRPGQTEADRIDLLVDFGFYKRVPAPGNGFEALFETSQPGTYELTITVEDAQRRNQTFHFTHVFQPRQQVSDPFLRVFANATNGDPAWAINPGESVAITFAVENPKASTVYDGNVTVSRAGADVATFPLGEGEVVTWTPSEIGAYGVRVEAAGEVGYAGVAVNVPDPSPFRLPESQGHIYTTTLTPSRSRLTINVTSTGASIASVGAFVRVPTIGDIDRVQLVHPTTAVPTNILEEFWAYMTSMLVGDFGRSLYSRAPVWDEISLRVGPSLLLFGSATIIAYALGVLVGAVLAWRRGSKMELSAIVVSLFFFSMPVFWFGLILLWLFGFTLGWFPLGGFATLEAAQAGGLTYALDVLRHMALPLLNLVILSLAGTILLMRNSMLEVMGEDYITTAKAKGISERAVMYRHAARNAMLPVVTAFALSISGVISGGVLTETIFSWPGMGAYLVSSTLQQDFPAVQGAFYLLAVLTILANLIADVLYAYLDPRVRL
ncbi:MAG: ABC transporter permease [Euryarchaeota archaeon]|nr:ABC transporter permease [Euryarchaeota archaeon]